MPTDTIPISHPSHARNFVLRGLAWSLALFGVLRLTWFEVHALLPLTRFQAQVAELGFGVPSLPVEVTLACSGAEAMALCAGAIVAYPVPWATRIVGTAGGLGLILALNTIRIGTLARVADSASWFTALHLYVWPTLLIVAIAMYVFAWMRLVDTIRPPASVARTPNSHRRFVLTCVAFVTVFTAAAPLYLANVTLLAAATLVAQAAAVVLTAVGVQATVSLNVLLTPYGGFAVTEECITTPLIPVYLAAVVSYARRWRWRLLGMAAVLPLFMGLGIARLLVVALPAVLIGSPLIAVHAFYQFILAVVVVYVGALWGHGRGANAWRVAVLGMVIGIGLACVIGLTSTVLLREASWFRAPLDDPQGALAMLPAFQFGLYVALAIGALTGLTWRPLVVGLALLAASQVVMFGLLYVGAQQLGLTPAVRDVRAWAILGPILAILAVTRHVHSRR